MHLSITSRPFRTFLKIRGDIRGSRCTTGVNHRWQMEKIFKQKNFNNFVWAPLGSRVNIYINFCLQKHFKVSAARYCSHYLPQVSTTAVANLPPVSMILVAICHRRRWQLRQFCHRCQMTPVANLPPVSLTPVVHLDWRISPRIFEKNLKWPSCSFQGLGGGWSMKKNWSK